jgi:hypothetical protein
VFVNVNNKLGGKGVKPKSFAIVFKSSDKKALEKLVDFINSELDDGKVVYAHGPTDKFLWILVGQAPREGNSVATSGDSA